MPLVSKKVTKKKEQASWWAICGYLTAALIPFLAILFAIPLAVRREYNHMAGVLLAALASFVIRLAILAGSGY